ncbi:MAG TPA: type IV pilus assembly protein PilM [Candidatus Dormibacteraeota bacterium]|nr:type IV pilus assembly protein PilM [Candidatus Dormibacteraeota bacterium]
MGSRTVKVVQLKGSGKSTAVQGYGYCYFPSEAVVEGIVVDPQLMAQKVKPLLKQLGYGSITAKRVVAGLPAGKTFIRTIQIPVMAAADLAQAVKFEAEQYVPVPINDLYLDHEIIGHSKNAKGDKEHMDVLMVAAPRAIVDSYIKLFDFMGLEAAAVESNMTAVVRAIMHSGEQLQSTLVIDIGSESTDLTIFDKVVPLTGSVAIGGEHFTLSLVKALSVQPDQATEIKVKFGIAESDFKDKVLAALEPDFKTMIKEAKRVLKFYQERAEHQPKVASVVIAGGSARMPGLADYMQKELGLPLVVANPWNHLVSNKVQEATKKDAPMFTTAVGLALREEPKHG